MDDGLAHLFTRLDEHSARVQAAGLVIAERWAMLGEGHMKTGAPWIDRTGIARKGLKGNAELRDHAIRVIYSHSVEYGPPLELAHGGKFAILRPTAETDAPEFLREVKEVLGI